MRAFGDEQRAAIGDCSEDHRAIGGAVDADVDERVRPDSMTDTIDVAHDEVLVALAEAGVALAKLGANHRVGFGETRDQRMEARSAVIVRIGAGQSTFLLAEYRHDRAVDVDVHLGALPRVVQRSEAVIADHLLEIPARLEVEALEVVVDRVDARHRATGQVVKDRVCGERLHAEDARDARDVRVDQEPKLRVHRVDDVAVRLEVAEPLTELAVDAELAHKRAEFDEATDSGYARVRLAHCESPGVGTTNAAPLPLQPMPLCALAADRFPSHLLGARRVCC